MRGAITFGLVLLCSTGISLASAADAVLVTPDNFPRAETDTYLAATAKEVGLAKFLHHREPVAIDKQAVIRMNRDTLYSQAVFDLDAGPVTVTLPNAGKRFMSMQVLDEDQYTFKVVYGAGSTTFTKEQLGTRYMTTLIRTLVDPATDGDLEEVHKLQDAIGIEQKGGPGIFEMNYTVRLYRPSEPILSGSWKFPEPRPVQ